MTAILFDLDRTLVDVQTHTDYGTALAELEASIGSWDDPPTPPTGWGSATRRAMGILVALTGDPRWPAISEILDVHEQRAIDPSSVMPGAHDALRHTLDRPVAVVTLLTDSTARAVLDHHGLEVGMVVGRRPDLAMKPAPDQLVEASRLLGVDPSETVMIGDSAWDAAAAEAAGSRFIGVTNGRVFEFAPDFETANTVDAAVGLIG